jgi:esterase/lipase superfamily enzyme
MDGRAISTLPAAAAILLVLVAIGLGCRSPKLPILEQKNLGVIYDTAMEEEIRSGKAHQLVLDTYGPYVDTLAEPVAVVSWQEQMVAWEVFAATNRGWYADPGDPVAANRVLDETQCGRCLVDIPKRQRGKEVQTASSRTGIKLASDSSQVTSGSEPVSVAQVESTPLSEEDYFAGVNQQLARSRQHDLLLFVHGFNVSFEAAVTRAAQLAFDIPFNGAVCAYCWPTQGGVNNYSSDEPINQASVQPFLAYLKALRRAVPSDTRIQIVVHSMGNRIVMDALDRLPTPSGEKPFNQLVLCAPDVGIGDFQKWAPGVVEQVDRVTMYASNGDSALIASKGLHAETRAGDAEDPVIAPGIETIDCSRLDTGFMGHSYYGSHEQMLTDLFMLLKEDKPADQRPHLKLKRAGQGEYWEFAGTAGRLFYNWHFEEPTATPTAQESETPAGLDRQLVPAAERR